MSDGKQSYKLSDEVTVSMTSEEWDSYQNGKAGDPLTDAIRARVTEAFEYAHGTGDATQEHRVGVQRGTDPYVAFDELLDEYGVLDLDEPGQEQWFVRSGLGTALRVRRELEGIMADPRYADGDPVYVEGARVRFEYLDRTMRDVVRREGR